MLAEIMMVSVVVTGIGDLAMMIVVVGFNKKWKMIKETEIGVYVIYQRCL